jgi:hypothetical protein
MDPRPNFGLGKIKTIDTVLVDWPNGKRTLLTQVKADQTLKLKQAEAKLQTPPKPIPGPKLFRELNVLNGVNYRHIENNFIDFDRDRLLYLMLSTEGPKIAKGDANGDGREDFYVGGAKDQAGKLFVQKPDGSFVSTNEALFQADAICEDQEALFFDADRDGDQDLYVCSGGNEFPSSSTALIDRLYLNNGSGTFSKSPQILPTFRFDPTSCVDAADYDRDGDLDLGFSNVNQPAALLENQSPGKGNWCSLELIGTKSNRDCIGAKVLFQTDKKRYLRIIYGGGSYLSQNPYVVHCAFPMEEQLQQTEITWPDGSKQSVADIPINQFHRIVEP